MTTKNPRINVTFEEATAGVLVNLALLGNKSVASIVRELALEALEMREDVYLSKVAKEIDIEGAKTYDHDTAWQ